MSRKSRVVQSETCYIDVIYTPNLEVSNSIFDWKKGVRLFQMEHQGSRKPQWENTEGAWGSTGKQQASERDVARKKRFRLLKEAWIDHATFDDVLLSWRRWLDYLIPLMMTSALRSYLSFYLFLKAVIYNYINRATFSCICPAIQCIFIV